MQSFVNRSKFTANRLFDLGFFADIGVSLWDGIYSKKLINIALCFVCVCY